MDTGDAADELYALPPERFTARRTELAAQAKTQGDAATAKEIGRLRRPTVSAWCLNVLVAAEDPSLVELLSVAEQLRQAQADLDAPLMGRLSGQRRTAVQQVQRAAAAAAAQEGQSVAPAAQREIEETLAAAVASADAAEAVSSGWLTRALSYAGFGEVDLAEATAAAPRRARSGPAPKAPPTRLRLVESLRPGPPTSEAARRSGTAAATQKAQAPDPAAEAARAVEQARAAVQEAQAAMEQARSRADDLAGTVKRLHDQLAAARAEAAAATRETTAAERRHASAEVTLSNAERRARAVPKGRL